MSGIFLHVRQGFEADAEAELSSRLSDIGIEPVRIRGVDDSAYIIADLDDASLTRAREELEFSDLIFARQLLWTTSVIEIPDSGDRAGVLIDALSKSQLPFLGANAYSSLSLETPDTDTAKELSAWCKSLSRPVDRDLNKLKLLPKGKGAAHLPRAHVVFVDSRKAYVAFSDPANSSPWVMGIPRLKFPADAPSRSTLKLEEAFLVFLGTERLPDALKPGMTGVDLGACPGGWTYQLVKRGIQTTAVDNGSMDSKLMSSGLVIHCREDAFKFRPLETVDWLVCDVVEQPSRIAELMGEWLSRGFCDKAVFNLKLPMKKRFEEVEQCLAALIEQCAEAGKHLTIRAKQLYHDRKEITVFASVINH